MLEIIIPEEEFWDEKNETFIYTSGTKGKKIQLEHSLISLRKWESKWHKPFLDEKEKTVEELNDYIRCMTLNHDVDPSAYDHIPGNILEQVTEYIKNPMTATWFSKDYSGKNLTAKKEIVTAEVIYCWMIQLNIPVEFQKWHLNQLMTLIKVVQLKSSPPKKMGKKEAAAQRRALNAQRRAKYKTRG